MNQDRDNLFRRAGWALLLAVATILGSFIFACATPFAALAALAALFLSRRDAFALVGMSWLANQIIGFGFLHYPQTWGSFAWGAALGVAALAVTSLAIGAEILLRKLGWIVTAVGAFAVAYFGYELILFAATAVLPSDSGVFGLTVDLYMLNVNGIAFCGLLVLQGLGQGLGLARPRLTWAPA